MNGTELRRCMQACIVSGTELSSQVQQQVKLLSKQLDSMGAIEVHCQHGDFCLNNLLVESDQLHIINFEDFGITSMPLHDEIALALSMFSNAPANVSTTLQHEIYCCIEKTQYRSILPGLFMHHLLLRLGQWSQGSRRRHYRSWLMSLLQDFAQAPNSYF